MVSGRRKDASQYEMNEKFRFFLLAPHSPKGDKITLPYSSCKCHVWDQYTTVVYSRPPEGNITHIFDGWGYVLCCIVLARSEGPTHMSSGRILPVNNLGNLRRMTEWSESAERCMPLQYDEEKRGEKTTLGRPRQSAQILIFVFAH